MGSQQSNPHSGLVQSLLGGTKSLPQMTRSIELEDSSSHVEKSNGAEAFPVDYLIYGRFVLIYCDLVLEG